MQEFTHLHCHSEYSFIPGTPAVEELCQKAHELGMRSLALTDSGNMCGVLKFYEACTRWNIKAILGSEFYIYYTCVDKNLSYEISNLVLLAQNNTGFANLRKLYSLSCQNSHRKFKPVVEYKKLAEYAESLICLSGSLSGSITRAILAGNKGKARMLVREFALIFPNRFYLELQKNGLEEQELINSTLLEISEQEKIPVIATNDCYYLTYGDKPEEKILIQSEAGKTKSSLDYKRIISGQLYLKSPEEMLADFQSIPWALDNTRKIAEKCNVELDLEHHFFPAYPLPRGETAANRVIELAHSGLNKKGYGAEKAYVDRLEKELETITRLGFSSYFLIMYDLIQFARENDIQIGPGRGSAPGSLILWALGVTEPDPIKYNLVFERFINSELIKRPDIDVDICCRQYDKVIQHMRNKYGDNKVSQLHSFGLLEAKKWLKRGIGLRGLSNDEIRRVDKAIPPDPDRTLPQYIQQNEELRKLYETDSRWRNAFDFYINFFEPDLPCIKGEGVIISDVPLSERVPVWKKGKNTLVQFDRIDSEKSGLMVFDLFPFPTLTILHDTLNNIKSNNKIVPVLEEIELDDEATYSLLASGDSEGIFQLDAEGMTEYFVRLKPHYFEEIIALLSLFRLGPIACGIMESFINRKNGKEVISFIHPRLENILKETFGLLIYQEQVMEIAGITANYSMLEADNLRRKLGKRKRHELEEELARFIGGAKNNGISKEDAEKIFSYLEHYYQYTFNKSHAAAYALLTYRTTWLKSHFPQEFMAAHKNWEKLCSEDNINSIIN